MNIRIFALMILALLTISSAHAESYTFTDSTSFTTVDYVSGSHNPAPVTTRTQSISGTTGVISDLNVSLNGVYSGGLMDMTYVLVGPNNTGVVLTSNAGNFSGGISSYTLKYVNSTFTFDDEAARKIYYEESSFMVWHRALPAGTYQTSAYLNAPDWWYYAEPGYTHALGWDWHGFDYNPEDIAVRNTVEDGIFPGVDFAETNLLSAFNDISANGEWKLLAYDNVGNVRPTVTRVSGGWTLDITTTPGSGAVPEPAEWMLIGLCACGIIILKVRGKHQATQV